MKRVLSMVLACLLVFTLFLGASIAETQGVKAPGDTLICLAISSLGNDFMSMLNTKFQEKFTGAGYQYQSASADGSAQKQIEQIENFVSMGADVIIVMAVEANGLTDVCQRAMDAGTAIYAFTTNTKAYTIYRGANDTIIGNRIAEMASEWVHQAFPDAQNGSVNCAIFKYMDSEETVERSQALSYIAEINPKVSIVAQVEVPYTTEDALAASENLAQTNPDIDLVLCYNGGMGIGVNSYVFSPSSAWKDYEHFGVFGSDKTDEILALIEASKTNESVYRGTAVMGGNINKTIEDIFANVEEYMSGAQDYVKGHFSEPTLVTAANVSDQ